MPDARMGDDEVRDAIKMTQVLVVLISQTALMDTDVHTLCAEHRARRRLIPIPLEDGLKDPLSWINSSTQQAVDFGDFSAKDLRFNEYTEFGLDRDYTNYVDAAVLQ